MNGDRQNPQYDPIERLIRAVQQLTQKIDSRRPDIDNPLIGPAASQIYRMADPLSRDENAMPGFDYGYSPGMNFGLNFFAGPVYGTPAAPGPITTVQYNVLNATHDVYFRLAKATGPFMVQVRVGDRQTTQTVTTGVGAGSGVNGVLSTLYFGDSASYPGTYLCPLRTATQDVVYFDMWDIANLGAVNYVSILMNGVVRGG